MIARFRLLLPFRLYRRTADDLQPFEFVQGLYRIRFHPPMLAMIDPSSIERPMAPSDTLLSQLRPSEVQATNWVLMDGSPGVEANLLQIDFHKEEFDRRRSTIPVDLIAGGDPPIAVAFEVVNRLLLAIRSLARGSRIHPLGTPSDHWWRLDYLTDDEQDLPDDPALFRTRFSALRTYHFVGVSREIWDILPDIHQDFRPPAWDALLLDADALLPDVGPAIVVAFAALESFIFWTLNQLATGRMPPELWEWINDRGDWRKEPSVSERFDILLRVAGGRSLTEAHELWEAFQNLRKARNAFMHEGRAHIGGAEVTAEQATNLVRHAHEIVDWVERLLPETLRRRRIERPTVWTLRQMILDRPTS